MNLLDLLLVLAFLLLVCFAKVPLTVFSVTVLVAVLCTVRVLRGERL